MFGIVGTVQRKIVWLCVLALMLSYRYHLTATAWKYSHRRTAFSNTCRFHSYCDPQKIAYNSVNTVADINTWKRYLVEFRGIYANFRLLELKEIVATLLYAEVDCSTADSLVDQMRFELSIPDSADVRYPLCVYTHLPNDAIARAAAERSCLIRSIVEVWADSTTSNDLVGQMDANFDRIITPTYLSDTNSNSTWKVEFRRFGRKGKSGLDIQGKQRLLSQFAPLLKKLNGSVDLMQPQHQLLYMEDWHSFHAESNEAIEKMKLNASNMDLISDIIPRRVFFGRIVGNGCSVQTIYDLKQRPFIGTTSMSAVSSHLTAVFSRTSADNDAKPIVLDPFCGTGSLLVAGAHLGADVVGSDYDADSLGLLNEKVAAVIPIKQRSKNSRFRRVDGFSQLGKSPVDNFEHYGTAAKLQQLFAADAAWWVNTPFDDSFHSTPPKLSKHDNQADALCFGQTAIRRYDKFDAIISDPPFGRRERVVTDSQNIEDDTTTDVPLEVQQLLLKVAGYARTDVDSIVQRDNKFTFNPYSGVSILLDLAHCRLKDGGRVVFWLPTAAKVDKEEVVSLLSFLNGHSSKRVVGKSIFPGSKLEYVTTECEELNDGLWRWLCVFKKRNHDLLE